MAEGARDRMVDAAARLLAQHGYQATSFSTVLEASGAPRGSIYHYFPGGKDQLVAAAIERAWERTAATLDAMPDAVEPSEVVAAFVGLWRRLLVATDFQVGCSVLGVVVSAPDGDVLARAGDVFRQWQSRLAGALAAAGVAPSRATDLGIAVLAACEGAVVLCRAQRSLNPLESVGRVLAALVAER